MTAEERARELLRRHMDGERYTEGDVLAVVEDFRAVRAEAIEEAAAECERREEYLTHATHHDGIGMGWLAGEELCRHLAAAIRARQGRKP